MTIHKRREVEIKVKLGDDTASFDDCRRAVKHLGFTHRSSRLETDYLPDTPDDLCKRSGLLLRFRKVETGNSLTWLLTLKQRAKTSGVLDYAEIETNFANTDGDTFRHIQQIVLDATGLTLDRKVLKVSDIDEVRTILAESGFTKNRILLDKYREEYSKGRDNITLDFFPDGMGAYMELESHTRTSLNSLMDRMGIAPEAVITDDYGDLLKEHKKALPPAERRVALFGNNVRGEFLKT